MKPNTQPGLFDEPHPPRRRKPARGGSPLPARWGSGNDLGDAIGAYERGHITDDQMGRVVGVCVSQLSGWELAVVARVIRDLLGVGSDR